MPVTQKEIAHHVGLSPQAVAHALSGQGTLSPATRAKILQTAFDLGYRPNPVARALTTGTTRLLSLWTTGLMKPYQVKIIQHLHGLVTASSYGLLVADAVSHLDKYRENKVESEGRPLEPGWQLKAFSPAEWPVDGIFALQVQDLPDLLVQRHGKSAPAIVQIGLNHPNFQTISPIDAVTIDLTSGSRSAVRHLLNSRSRVAFLGLATLVEHREGRYVAYETEMREAGRELELITSPFGDFHEIYTNAQQVYREHVAQRGHPDAVFCATDIQAIAVHRVAHEMGLKVPDDLALVGCNGTEHALYHVPTISTIVQPFEEMCRQGWEIMQQRMNEPDAPPEVRVLEAQFEARESS